MRALLAGPLDRHGVAAASGLGPDTAARLLDALVDAGMARAEGELYVGDPGRLREALA
jgi:hypothetical protein